ncbi:MAG: hypothetical protein GC206_12140 [Alphaproteobacteria bacterium]|nr:hypothetical protein [Alphaproteobacteria bacterium]
MSKTISNESLCVNAEEVDALTAPFFANLSVAGVAARAATLAAASLRADPACRRPPRAYDFAGPHKIAEREALALGRPCHVVAVSPAQHARFATLAVALNEVCAASQRISDVAETKVAMLYQRARRILTKAGNMSLTELERQAREFARDYGQHVRETAARKTIETPIYEHREIAGDGGATWRLLRSCLDLTVAGAALRNCWAAERPFSARYQEYLRTKQAEFWTLWPVGASKPTRALMLDLKTNAVVEVRGPANLEVSPAAPDVLAFLAGRRCKVLVTVLNSRMAVDHVTLPELLDLLTRTTTKPKDDSEEDDADA